MGRFNRLFKCPELSVVTLGTGRTAHQLADLMGTRQANRSTTLMPQVACFNARLLDNPARAAFPDR